MSAVSIGLRGALRLLTRLQNLEELARQEKLADIKAEATIHKTETLKDAVQVRHLRALPQNKSASPRHCALPCAADASQGELLSKTDLHSVKQQEEAVGSERCVSRLTHARSAKSACRPTSSPMR